MNREYTEQDYNNYIRVINYKIWETEIMLNDYEKRKKLIRLSFEQWVQWMDAELSLNDIEVN